MNVNILIGAQHAYACIEDGGRQLDVLLSPGHSAAHSLRESVKEMRALIAIHESRADLIERAINFLENEQ